jgi:phthalate 4,5-dioxygenase oxygenase subunit
MTSEPADSGFTRKVTHTAYPTREAGGFVWIYMGPTADMPAFEPPAFAPAPDVRVSILKIKVKANWAQITEGQIDSAHSSSLHSSDMVPARVESAWATDANWLRPSTDKAPRLEVQRTSFGFRYAAIRRPIANAATHQYVRTTVYVAPFTSLIPPNNVHNVATVLVPMDDASTYFYFIAWNGPDKPGIHQEAWRKFNHAQPGIDLDADFTNRRTRDNNYLQDRKAMKLGSFTGIAGIPNQDIAMWETMGRTSMSDRTRERLGASDVAVIQFRRIMIEAARRLAAGGPALGRTAPHHPHAKISSFEGVVPKTTDWRTLGVSPEELAAGGTEEVA